MEITIHAQQEAIRQALHYLSLLGIRLTEASVHAYFYDFTLEPDDEVSSFKKYRHEKAFERLRQKGYFSERFWSINIMSPAWDSYCVNITPAGQFISFKRNICSSMTEGFTQERAHAQALDVMKHLCGIEKVKLLETGGHTKEGDAACCPGEKNQVYRFVFQDLSDLVYVQKSILKIHLTIVDGFVTQLHRTVEISPRWRILLYVMYMLFCVLIVLGMRWLFSGWYGTIFIPILFPSLR